MNQRDLRLGNGLIYASVKILLSSILENLDGIEEKLMAMGGNGMDARDKIILGALITEEVEPGIEAAESKISAIKRQIAALKNGGGAKK